MEFDFSSMRMQISELLSTLTVFLMWIIPHIILNFIQ